MKLGWILTHFKRIFFMNDNKLDLSNPNFNFILLMKNLLLDMFDHIRGVNYTYRAESADELITTCP